MKRTVVNGIIGVAALAGVLFAGLRIMRQVRQGRGGPGRGHLRIKMGTTGGGNAWHSLVRPAPEATSPRTDPNRVIGWWVETRPVLVAADCPRITQAPQIQYRAAPDLPKLAPAVAVQVHILVEGPPIMRQDMASAGRNVPGAWLGLQHLELSRADVPGGPFRIVQTQSKKQLDGLRIVSCSQPTRAPLYRYDFSLIDRDVPPHRTLRYKVRFAASKRTRAVPAESGVCTAAAFDLPRATLVLTAKGRPALEWNAASTAIPSFLGHPTVVVGTTGAIYGPGIARTPAFTELGRASFTKGRIELPPETVNPGLLAPLGYAVEGVWNVNAWSSFEGGIKLGERCSLCRPVTEHGPKVEWPSRRREGRAFAFYPRQLSTSLPTAGRLPENPGIDIADFYHPGRPSANLRIQAADGGPPVEIAPDRNGRWSVEPGIAVHLNFSIDDTVDGKSRTLRCSTVRPPYPTGFRTAAGNGEVRLAWDPLAYSPKDWVEGPEFVVRRAYADNARVQPGRWLSYGNFTPFRVIYRGPASVTKTVDRDVENERLYLYALSVEGVARATGELSGGQPCSFNLPMTVWYCPGGGGLPNVAVPRAPRPIRLAVTSFDRSDLGAEFLRRAVCRRLGQESWVRLVERTEAPSLRQEEQIANLGPDATDSSAGGPGRIAADAVVFVASEKIGTARNLTIWWIDYQNGFSRRILQTSVWDFDLKKAAEHCIARIKVELGARAIHNALSVAAEAQPKDARKHVAAILGLTPLSLSGSKAGFPAKALEDLLGVALGSSKRWQTVDREHLTAVLSELGTSWASSREESLQLGRLLGADILLQGWYTTIGDRLTVTLQPLDVHRGVQLPTVKVNGPLDLPGDLMARASRRLDQMTTSPIGPASHPLLLALESQVTAFGFNRRRSVERRTYVLGATPDELFELGNTLASSSRIEDALTAYRRGLDMALATPEASAFPGRLAREVDRILARGNHTAERLQLWRRMLAFYEQQHAGAQAADTHLRLANVLLDQGNKAAAARELLHIRNPSPHNLARMAAILERLGRTEEALALYLKADWVVLGAYGPTDRTPRPGPAYAAAIHYLRTAQPETRRRLRVAIVRNLSEIHPIHALKAFEELQKDGAAPASLRPDVWRMLKTLHTPARINEFADSLLKTIPTAVEELRLWNDIARYYLQQGEPSRAAKFARKVVKARLKTPAAKVQKKLAKKYLDQEGRGRKSGGSQPDHAMPNHPVIDEALRSYVTHGGGRQLGDDVYVLTENGFVLRMSPDAATVRWACSLEYQSPFPRRARSPANRRNLLHNLNRAFWLSRDMVYAVNIPDGVLFAIDARTGRKLWRYADWTHLSPPIALYRKQQVVVANAFGELLVFSAPNGKLLLRAPGPARGLDSFADKYVDLQTDYPQNRFFISFATRPGFFGERNTDALRGKYDKRLHEQGHMAVYRPRGDYYFEMPDMKVHEIADLAKPPTFADLARKLLDKSIPDRDRLINIALWRGANRDVTNALTAICRDPEESRHLRDRALRALAGILGDAAAPLLIQTMASSDVSLGITAAQEIRALAREGKVSPDDIDLLAQRVRRASGSARGVLVSTLLDLACASAKPALHDILANPKDPLYGRVIAALAEAGDPDMLEPLRASGTIDAWLKHPTDQILRTLAALGEASAQARVREKIDIEGLLVAARQAETLPQKRLVAAKARKALDWIRNCLPDPACLPAIRELANLLRDDKGRCLISNSICWACVALNQPDSVRLIWCLREEAAASGFGLRARFAPVTARPLAVATGVDFGSDLSSWRIWRLRQRPRL